MNASPLSPPARSPRPRTLGFTLVELVVSLAVISVLMVGMTSAIVLASRALPTHETAAAATVESGRALHQLRDDLRAATELLNRTANSVTLNLPDRDGDGRPEVVTYAWSGASGDPITRSVNDNSAINLLESVQTFTLSYTTAPLDRVFPGPATESAEVLLSSFDTSEVIDAQNSNLDSNQLLAAQIAPNLPNQATAYRVTRALVYARAGGNGTGQYGVQVRRMNGAEPADVAIESVTTTESDLTDSFDWSETVFAIGGPFGSNEDFALVLEQESGGNAGQFRYDNTATSNLIRSSNGGDVWTYSTNDRLVHFTYGTYDAPADDWTFTLSRVTGVDLTLVTADAAAITHRLSLPLPNAPEAVDALWEADFNADPTPLDLGDDGQTDWIIDGTFNTGNLADGRWTATDAMRSGPDNLPLDAPFTVAFWGEDTIDNGDTGGIRFRFDRSGNQQAYVTVEIDLTASGQVVQVLSKDASGAGVTWHTQIQPAGAPIHVELSVDPGNDTVGVVIDGEVAGSFVYERLSNSANLDGLKPYVDGSSSGFRLDHLRMTVGGSVAITPGAY